MQLNSILILVAELLRVPASTNIAYEELEVGATLKLRLKEKIHNGPLFMVNGRGKCYKKLIDIHFNETLKDYATTVASPYVPKNKELCIVKHGKYLEVYFYF